MRVFYLLLLFIIINVVQNNRIYGAAKQETKKEIDSNELLKSGIAKGDKKQILEALKLEADLGENLEALWPLSDYEIKKFILINTKSKNPELFSHAVRQNDIETVRFLLKRKIDPNNGLRSAIEWSRPEMVKLFLENEAAASPRILIHALEQIHELNSDRENKNKYAGNLTDALNILGMLLSRGANINATVLDDNGRTQSILRYITERFPEAVQSLLNAGVEITKDFLDYINSDPEELFEQDPDLNPMLDWEIENFEKTRKTYEDYLKKRREYTEKITKEIVKKTPLLPDLAKIAAEYLPLPADY